jgi:hypothetical protein
VEVGNPICNTFQYCNVFQISTNFELFKRFRVTAGLTEMCSHRLIATIIANRPELHFGQGVLHGDIKYLHYRLVDMHKLSPKIQEVIEFQRWLIVELIWEKLCLETGLYNYVCLYP